MFRRRIKNMQMDRKTIPTWIPSYGILLLTIVLAVLIAFVPDKSPLFLTVLCLNLVFCVLNRKFFSSSVVAVVRSLVGLLFIFSGFTKGVDPLGTTYVIHDYLEAYNLPWLTGLSLFGSFFLNMLEFTIGVCLLFNVKFKWTVIVTALMMLFFTATTWYDAVANPVPDCGCFGKAVVMTNWQTFYKNLVLDACVLVLLFSMNRIPDRRPAVFNAVIAGAAALLFLGFEYYNYRYLPVVNFLEWKEGTRLFPENPQPVQHFVTYRNKLNGETKEYLLEECPYADPIWVENWEFVDRRDVDPNPQTVNINIVDKVDDEDPGWDVTKDLLETDSYLFLVAVYDLEESDREGMAKVAEAVKRLREAGYECCFLTSSTVKEAEECKKTYGLEDFMFYYSDNTAIKAVIRSNPGIVLLRDAWVLKLWDWRRFPAPEDIDLAALSQEVGFDGSGARM